MNHLTCVLRTTNTDGPITLCAGITTNSGPANEFSLQLVRALEKFTLCVEITTDSVAWPWNSIYGKGSGKVLHCTSRPLDKAVHVLCKDAHQEL